VIIITTENTEKWRRRANNFSV